MSNEEKINNIDSQQENPITEIESLCMNCEKKGTTRLLLTSIPFYKDIILMSFSCPNCGYKNTEIEQNEELPKNGIKFELKVQTEKDFNRRVIKTNFATIKIPFCGLEIPPNTQKGKINTIEGFILTTKENFENSLNDGYYNEMGEEFINKIKDLINKLENILNGKNFPFDFILDDPGGNSFIENPFAPQTDPNIKVTYYKRTKEMLEQMGFSVENQKEEIQTENQENKEINKENNKENIENQVQPSYYNKKEDFNVYKSYSEISTKILDFTKGFDNNDNIEEIDKNSMSFPTNCYICHSPGFLRSCICTIPYFKEIIISCFKCEKCGYKTTDVKGGGGISEKGTKLTLKVENNDDLNRDVFKSETSKILIPEIGFESSDGSIGSMYTTIEGIIDKLIENLKNLPFGTGDSKISNDIDNFIKKLEAIKNLQMKFTIVIDDPLSNSFIFPIGESPENDKRLIKEEYERTYEQNEEFGINDMKTENYENKNEHENKNGQK
jgi:zinc finger protein